MNLFAYVNGNPVNWIDPEGLDLKSYPHWHFSPGITDPENNPRWYNSKAPDKWYNWSTDPSQAAQNIVNFVEGNCYVSCLMEASLGSDMPPLTGELATQAYGNLGTFALELAEKTGKTSVIIKRGAYLVPGLGTLSTALTAYNFVKCSICCQE